MNRRHWSRLAVSLLTLLASASVWRGLSGDHPATPSEALVAAPLARVAEPVAAAAGTMAIPKQTGLSTPTIPDRQRQTLSLIRQLHANGHQEELFRLTTLLSNRESGEGLRVARLLLADADQGMRRVGVDILTGYSLSEPAIHDEVSRLLRTEQDVNLLVHLLDRLDAPIDLYGKDHEISAALHGLLSHANPDVRSQAILQMLQWDDYATLEGFLYQALNDSSAEVRLSAATVTSLIDTRSTTLKGALLSMRDNPQESRDVHESVIAALNHIDTSEYENRSAL